MLKLAHYPNWYPVTICESLDMDKLMEIREWGIASLNDKEAWKQMFDETLTRMRKDWYGRRGIVMLQNVMLHDEYVFYFSNKEDAMLFKLAWA